ncbi:MAG: regulatory protein RecX [Nocardioidaceae bacterium]|nr:regulatory protein RecX [Nocardioidaceae bacterium]
MAGPQSARRSRGQRRQVEPEDPGRDLGPPADPESIARNIVLTKLTGQPRSRHELADALAARDVPDDVAAAVLDRFEDVGLVDDAAYAEAWVRSRQTSRGLSKRALSLELRRKGVDDEVVRDAVATIDTEAEVAAARRLVDRKLRTMGRLDRQTRLRRLTGLLARKGYPSALSARLVREAVDAAGESDRPYGTGAEFDSEARIAGPSECDEDDRLG